MPQVRRSTLEQWALSVAETALRQTVEDSHVELKAELIGAEKCARQLAGHANSAQGEPILWLIGIDEKRRQVTGSGDYSLHDWVEQLRKRFDEGISPQLIQSATVPFEDKTILALCFATDQAPYVIKTTHGGGIDREVPWRHGTATQTAYRRNLLSLQAGDEISAYIAWAELAGFPGSLELAVRIRFFSREMSRFGLAMERSYLELLPQSGATPLRIHGTTFIRASKEDAREFGLINGTAYVLFVNRDIRGGWDQEFFDSNVIDLRFSICSIPTLETVLLEQALQKVESGRHWDDGSPCEHFWRYTTFDRD